MRAKGHFWLATRPDRAGEMSLAGAVCRTGGGGQWWAATPRDRWPDVPEWRGWIDARGNPVWGGRRQEIVCIGAGLDEQAIRAALGEALTGPDRPTADDWRAYARLPDPFPTWRREAA